MRLKYLIAQLKIFDYDLLSAQWHAQERARLVNLGKNPAFADGQIASIAFVNNFTLVTNNLDDLCNFNGLVVESWFA
jgi:tRNA(fMet)-specific endonuclease VapC